VGNEARVGIRIVADFKTFIVQFITNFSAKILSLNLALKPLLFLYIVLHWLSLSIIKFLLSIFFIKVFFQSRLQLD
jgi:hypothetical protein